MAQVTIRDVPPYDGEYEIDLRTLDMGEHHRIRTISGLRPAEYVEALVAHDSALVVALCAITLEREGKRVEYLDPFWRARGGQLVIDFTRSPQEVEDEDSPPQAAPQLDENKSGANDTPESSGSSSSSDGDTTPEPVPSSSGAHG